MYFNLQEGMSFIQEGPELGNQYLDDPVLQYYMDYVIPDKYQEEIIADLESMGKLTTEIVKDAGDDAIDNEPELLNFDAWGERVDKIITSSGWKKLHDIAAEEGLVAIGYERNYGQYSRVYQMAKLLLYTPSSAIYTCPLAMTDGAARLIEMNCPELLSDQYNNLISRIPQQFWTAGQWMTEKEGGSDLSDTSTIARKEDDIYRLYGDKWFTSAIDADMAMTLARIEQDDGTIPEGSRGLSLFYLRIRDNDGNLNNLKIHKLKDKLGTRSLPTAELTLEGSEAIQIGEPGRGVKLITTILNITRLYNAISSISYMHRGLLLAKDYATRRNAFGQSLIDLPLHQQVLADLEVEYASSFFLTFYAIELMGKVETYAATEEEQAIFRLLTPLVKLYTGKRVVSLMSEVVESFGGMGYIEETDIPVLFRDAQVFPIWEGTTNVLSLDVLRAMRKEGGFAPLLQEIVKYVKQYDGDLDTVPVLKAVEMLREYVTDLMDQDEAIIQAGARLFAFSIARTVAAYRLLKMSVEIEDTIIADKIGLYYIKFVKEPLVKLLPLDEGEIELAENILSK